MQGAITKSYPVPENLDTAYISLGAFLRYLQQRDFKGWIHVELDDYEADIHLTPNEQLRVVETDHTTGRVAEGDPALHRLLVRAMEPGGLVSVYGSAHGDIANLRALATDSVDPGDVEPNGSKEDADVNELSRLSGELIGAVERAALSTGADFGAIFHSVSLALADDYPFLDPSTGGFEYGNGAVRLRATPSDSAYLSGVSDLLRHLVTRIADGPRGKSVRERVALELAVLARRKRSQLAKFKFSTQLDRIAGTKVL